MCDSRARETKELPFAQLRVGAQLYGEPIRKKRPNKQVHGPSKYTNGNIHAARGLSDVCKF